MPGKYRGIDRDPIQPWIEAFRDSGVVEPTKQELDASLFMEELTKAEKAGEDFIFLLNDARRLLEMIPSPIEREIIWARRMDRADPPPPETVVLGYEPTAFYAAEHESVIANNAFFRYWRSNHQDDPNIKRFKAYHAKLNKWGLFDTPIEAQHYWEFILGLISGKRTEEIIDYIAEGIDYIAEIRAVENKNVGIVTGKRSQ
jgi:hypothetical protein